MYTRNLLDAEVAGSITMRTVAVGVSGIGPGTLSLEDGGGV